MLATAPTIDDKLTDLLNNLGNLSFELPDPEDDTVRDTDFDQAVANAWLVCDRCDLQTEIWRGRILRVIRDRVKRGGDGRGTGFLNWLKEREITKSQAYGWIQLANSADALIAEGNLDESTLKQFSKRAFVETSKAVPEVQQMVMATAQGGDRITCREVKQLANEFAAMSSDLLPDEVKEAASDISLPSRHLAPLVKELEKLPKRNLEAIQETIAADPTEETVKAATKEAKYLSTFLDAAGQVSALKECSVDVEAVGDEALRQDALSLAAKVAQQAKKVQEYAAKLYTAWSQLDNSCDSLYPETAANTPAMRSMLRALDTLIKDNQLEIPFGEKRVRIKLELIEE